MLSHRVNATLRRMALPCPPCHEDVRWSILTEPIQVSEAQIATFESPYHVNARPVQPINGRIVELHED